MLMIRHLLSKRASRVLLLVALAVLARAAIPAGWMPTVQGERIAVSVCSGEGRAVMWLDKAGKLHKSNPSQDDQDHPCAFASVSPALNAPDVLSVHLVSGKTVLTSADRQVSIGQGLAAPPPPSTGPPVLI
jgi:hypothetical protein